MIAICNRSGAFLYNCSEQQADEWLAKYLDDEKISDVMTAGSTKGGMDYTEKGEMRKKGGMCGWLFMDPELISMLKKIGCEAAYIETGRVNGLIIKYKHSRFQELEEAFQLCFPPQKTQEYVSHTT